MTYVRQRVRRVRPVVGLSVLAAAAAVAAVLAAAALGGARATPINIAILSDCKGPFGNQYNADIGGAEAAFAQFAGSKLVDPSNPTKGFTGGSGAGHPPPLGRAGLLD